MQRMRPQVTGHVNKGTVIERLTILQINRLLATYFLLKLQDLINQIVRGFQIRNRTRVS